MIRSYNTIKPLKAKDGNVLIEKISKILSIGGGQWKIQKYIWLNIVCLKSKYTHILHMSTFSKDIQTNDSKLFLGNENQYLGRKDSHSVFFFFAIVKIVLKTCKDSNSYN